MNSNYEQKFIVELSDITPGFGLKSTSVLRYYQETFARYCAEHNVAGYDVFEMGLKWVFGESVIKYHNIIPIWNEEITAKVYINSVKKLRIYINFEISTSRGLVATGQSIAYILDLVNSRPQPVDNIVKYFNLDTGILSTEIEKTNFEDFGELLSSQTHTITFADVDYNNHTNNISYISLCFEGMPANYIQEYYPDILKIRYLKETFLGDTLTCEIYQLQNDFQYKILDAKDSSLVCLVNASWKSLNMTPEKFFEILNKKRCTKSN